MFREVWIIKMLRGAKEEEEEKEKEKRKGEVISRTLQQHTEHCHLPFPLSFFFFFLFCRHFSLLPHHLLLQVRSIGRFK